MSSPKHTPGPWTTDGADTTMSFPLEVWDGAGQKKICIVFQRLVASETRANAALIAAAPQLLECCEFALRMMDGGRPDEDLAALRAAIAKAKGGAP